MKQETPYQIVVKDRIDYRFSRVYLLRFSKGQFGPRDNNNTERRVYKPVLICLGVRRHLALTLDLLAVQLEHFSKCKSPGRWYF